MKNRKFDIKKDFAELNRMQNKMLPMLDEIKDEEKKDQLKTYIRNLFFDKFKTSKMIKVYFKIVMVLTLI
jgi:hypothetical protein